MTPYEDHNSESDLRVSVANVYVIVPDPMTSDLRVAAFVLTPVSLACSNSCENPYYCNHCAYLGVHASFPLYQENGDTILPHGGDVP